MEFRELQIAESGWRGVCVRVCVMRNLERDKTKIKGENRREMLKGLQAVL